MAVIHPFKAWRPDSDKVAEISCVPYDVINTNEARALAEGKPQSFLRVIRPEIDLPESVDIHDDEVYEKGAENLKTMMDEGYLQQDDELALFIYRLKKDNLSQTGVFGCVSVDDYDNDVILKHELTRPAKEDDRTRHIRTQSAHAEPVMMTFKDTVELEQIMEEITDTMKPLYDFTAPDGVHHTIWKITITQAFEQAFADLEHLYIADGHHRCKSASRVAADLRRERRKAHTGEEEYNYFPAVLFPMEQMHILPYNRILYEVSSEQWNKLNDRFSLKKESNPAPAEKGRISIYYKGEWYGLTLPIKEDADAVKRLDVARLQEFLLGPVFGIRDQRADTNLHFVGGIRGTVALEKLVDSGEADMAISMYATSIEELIEVSDEGKLMPPKSTWFEPKLRSGLIVHTF